MNNLMVAGTTGIRKEDELEGNLTEARAMVRQRQQQAVSQVMAEVHISAQLKRAKPISERHTWAKEPA